MQDFARPRPRRGLADAGAGRGLTSVRPSAPSPPSCSNSRRESPSHNRRRVPWMVSMVAPEDRTLVVCYAAPADDASADLPVTGLAPNLVRRLQCRGGGPAMPLRDHFRPPLDDLTSWEGFHGQWPAMLVLSLGRKLPRRYIAAPRVHAGSSAEIDVATYDKDDPDSFSFDAGNGNGGVATAVWAPSQPTLTVATELPASDEYEVRVYDTRRGRRLVAAVEIVSPANKDRPDSRAAFVAKCVALLQSRVCVT